MKLSKNAIRKFRRYGKVPSVVREFQNLEESAWKKDSDGRNRKNSEYAELAPSDYRMKIGDMYMVKEPLGTYKFKTDTEFVKSPRRYTGSNAQKSE